MRPPVPCTLHRLAFVSLPSIANPQPHAPLPLLDHNPHRLDRHPTLGARVYHFGLEGKLRSSNIKLLFALSPAIACLLQQRQPYHIAFTVFVYCRTFII